MILDLIQKPNDIKKVNKEERNIVDLNNENIKKYSSVSVLIKDILNS